MTDIADLLPDQVIAKALANKNMTPAAIAKLIKQTEHTLVGQEQAIADAESPHAASNGQR